MRARGVGSIFGAAMALLLLSAPPAFAQAPGSPYRTFRPDGPGPHPAVVFAAGCEGFAPAMAPTVYERRAEHLRARGHFVVFVDSLGRRGLKTCAVGITHAEVARDLAAAAASLRSEPTVDPSRISAMGWSYGGRAVLMALAAPGGAPAFSRAVVFYPDCRGLDPWRAALPVLMLLGGDDDMTPTALCQEVARKVADPAALKVVVYPGARHAFDVPGLPPKMPYGFASIGYDPRAAASAQNEVDQFLRAPR
jgi:dienelactone hydrolase